MRFLVIHEVDNEEVYEIVEADTPEVAANKSGYKKLLNGEWSDKDVELVGLYELCSFNHLESIEKNFEIHRFYRKKIEGMGFNPNTFEEETK